MTSQKKDFRFISRTTSTVSGTAFNFCWHLCSLSQAPEAGNSNWVSLYQLALKTFIGTLTLIINDFIVFQYIKLDI